MAYTIEKLVNEPIIEVTFLPPFEGTDIVNCNQEVEHLMAGIPGTVFLIMDVTAIMPSFSLLVDSLDRMVHDKTQLHQESRLRSLLVGKHQILDLAVTSLQQQQYGKRRVEMRSSMTDALAYARAELAKNS